jgi:hypothetical protein
MVGGMDGSLEGETYGWRDGRFVGRRDVWLEGRMLFVWGEGGTQAGNQGMLADCKVG